MLALRFIYAFSMCAASMLSAQEQTPIQTAASYVQQGIKLQESGKNHEAIESFNKALTADTNCFEAHYRLGSLHRHFDQFDQSIEHFRAAMNIQPTHTGAILELANTLNTVDRPEECLGLYKKALEINPRITAALYNLGYTLKKLGRVKEALEIYDLVLDRNSDYSLAHFSRALTYLALGDFERGWQEYEWRWKAYDEKPRSFKQPTWDGSPLQGKRLLIYEEQGLGDTLQFIRYAKLAKEQGAYVIFHSQKALKTLLSRCCSFLDKVVTHGDPLPEFDLQIPLMSMPLVFKTKVDTVPLEIPYITPDTELVREWKTKLAADPSFKIGICWQGNANYRTQFLRQAVAAKSMHLKHFAPLARIPGVKLYSLQKVFGTDQLKEIGDSLVVHDFGADFDESHGRFMDTAAVMKSLDLVVTVDTSIAHMAGSLGVPVWVPLPFPADWRWMLNRADTPWYPNMRLFRKTKSGDWLTVMNLIATEIEHIIANESKPEHLQEVITEALPIIVSLAELADKVTMHAFNPAIAVSHEEEKTLRSYSQRLPIIATLSAQLEKTNGQLWHLEQRLQANSRSGIDQNMAELARKIYYAYNAKESIKQQISRVAIPN